MVASKSNKQGQRRGKKQAANLSANAVAYNGPIMVPGGMRGQDMITILATEINDVAWQGAGTTTVFVQQPSVGTTSAYTDPYGDYREYRCLGMSSEFVPLFQPTQTNESVAALGGYLVASSIEKTPNGSAFIGTSLVQMADNTSFEIHESGKKAVRTIKMNGTEEAAWGDSSLAAVSQFSVGWILDTRITYVPFAQIVGTIITRRLMQFRNRFN